MNDAQRLDTLRLAAEAKAKACIAAGEAIAAQVEILESIDRTAGTRIMLLGLMEVLKAEHASAKTTLADVISIVASQTK